jgi:3-mercaptopyruvate sulfurtransferase SseA
VTDEDLIGFIPEVLIRPEILHSWLSMGYGVDTFGYNRMVILAVDSREGYQQGHVPGAYLLEENETDLWATRSNGVSVNPFQVATREQMDAIISRTNIDADAVIVLTGGSLTGIGRAYFNFRYWGFPRQQLKVLNSTMKGYRAAGYPLQREAPPSPEISLYSVCSAPGLSAFSAIRASLAEMLKLAEKTADGVIIVDSRPAAAYEGSPGSTLLDRETQAYAAFEGHVKNALNLDSRLLLVAGNEARQLLPKDDLQKVMQAHHIIEDKISFVYGSNGQEDSLLFLALDAGLNWPVKLFDGGWSLWGQLAGNSPTSGGMLPDDSPWRTDTPARSAAITYNKPQGLAVAAGEGVNPYTQHGSGVNILDMATCGRKGEKLQTLPVAPGY